MGGRLSQEEIERMVQEAEEFQEEDKKVREKIESRNQLENYVYSMKNTLSDSEKGVADKIGDEDKETIEKALEEANEWLDDNQDGEKEDFEEKLKDGQDVCSPIISKVYRESGGAPGGGGDFGGDDDLDGHDELWIWEYPLEEDEHKDFFMDPGETIRFRVCSESFVDTGPSKAKTGESDG